MLSSSVRDVAGELPMSKHSSCARSRRRQIKRALGASTEVSSSGNEADATTGKRETPYHVTENALSLVATVQLVQVQKQRDKVVDGHKRDLKRSDEKNKMVSTTHRLATL